MANDTPSQKQSLGERRLAAIMFTDVVSFSARVQENENLTLRLVQRDFKAIASACNSCGGQVLKTTGDGLLMSFPTAGAAVECALRVQKMVAEAGRKLPPEQVLHHRIGIHLGDVFIADKDVMGNDVNIAARVLSEAGSGEICVSQTVYDVVKHRLTVKGVYLGQRELKNIADPVSIFRLPTSLNEAMEQPKPSAPKKPPARSSASAAPPRQGPRLVAMIALLAVAIAAGITVWKIMDKPPAAPVATTQPAVVAAPPPATTRAVSRATANLVDIARRGSRSLRGTVGSRIGGINVAETLDFIPKRPYAVALEGMPGGAEVTLLDGEVYRGQRGPRGNMPGAVVSSTAIKLRIKLPESTPLRMTLGFGDIVVDQNQESRAQSIWINDAITSDPLAQTNIGNFREQQLFVMFDVTGDIEVIIKSEKGPGVLLHAIIFNPIP